MPADDCWASADRLNNTLTWDTDRFPTGIPALTEWLHSVRLELLKYLML